MAGRKPLSRNFTSKSLAVPSISPEYVLEPCNFTVECETPIGVGGCSSVYMGLYRGSPVAVKYYTIGNTEPAEALLLQEAESLLKLHHLNVIKCLGICLQKSSLLLELAEIKITHNGRCVSVNSLRQLIDTVGDVMEQDLKHEALFQVLEGLNYIHNNTIVHGDLKSANVLVSEVVNNYVFKLTDFGGSHAQISTKVFSNFSSVNTGKRVKPGTTSFEAPEVFQGKEKSHASDVYSFEMIMHELLYQEYSHPSESVFKQCSPNTLESLIIDAVKRGQRPKIEVHDDSLSPYIHVMQLCWAQEAAERPSLISLKVEIENLEIEAEKQRDLSSKTLSVSKNKSPQLPKVGNNSPLKESILARKIYPLAKRKLDFNDDHSNSSASSSMTRIRNNESPVSSLASPKLILSNSEEDNLNGEQLRNRADKRRSIKKPTSSRDPSPSSESQCDEDGALDAFGLSVSDQGSPDSASELNTPTFIFQKEADDKLHPQEVVPRNSSKEDDDFVLQNEANDELFLQKESGIPQDEVMKWQCQ